MSKEHSMSHVTRSFAAVLLALAIVLMAVAVTLVPQGADDARRKITLGPAGPATISQPVTVNASA